MSMDLVRALPRVLAAETLKLRGTLALWMCLVAPAAVAALVVLQLTLSPMVRTTAIPPAEAWERYAMTTMQFWAFLMMPLFLTLQSALLAGLEHGNHQWKHLFALPVPRGSHYLGKLIALAGMLAMAMALLLVLIPMGGWTLGLLRPALGIAGPPPMGYIAPTLLATFTAGLLITALHNWIALRWRSFTVAVSIGMVATVAGVLIMQSARFGYLYPWAMPVSTMTGKGMHLAFVVKAGLVGGVAVALIGLWDFVRREEA